jgi:hypothetical protein
VKFVRGKKADYVAPAEAMVPLEIGWAAQESMESGQPVVISPIRTTKRNRRVRSLAKSNRS